MADVPLIDNSAGSSTVKALADAALGVSSDSKSNTTQDTSNTSAQQTGVVGSSTTAQATTGSTATSGTANSQQSGSTTQNQNGSMTQAVVGSNTSNTGTTQNTNQQQTGSTSTVGSNTTTGTQATTGTVNTSGTSTQKGTQTTSNSADTTGLREVLARQLGGLTPDMMQAIFQEGAKAAPNLVVAQAGALGARGVGNSPMAQVLNQLNTDLTNKAALANIQMLSDAGTTAGKIADATRQSTTATDMTTATTQQQVQDLLTSTNSKQLTDQVASMVSSTVGQMAQAQQQTGTSSQSTSGTSAQTTNGTSQQNTAQQSVQNQLQSQNVTGTATNTQDTSQTGTQTQHSTSSKEEKALQQKTINSNLLGKAAGIIAGGTGLLAAYNAAKASGLTGDIASFAKELIGKGLATLAQINKSLPDNAQLVSDALGNINYGTLTTAFPDTDSNVFTGDLTNPFTGDFTSDTPVFGFADGGQLNFLAVPDLDKEDPKKQDEKDTDLSALLAAVAGGSYSSAAPSPSSSAAPAPVGPAPASAPVDIPKDAVADPVRGGYTQSQGQDTTYTPGPTNWFNDPGASFNTNTETMAGQPEWMAATNLANISEPGLRAAGYTGPTVIQDIHMGTSEVAPQLIEWLNSKGAKLGGSSSATAQGGLRVDANVTDSNGTRLASGSYSEEQDAIFGALINLGVAAVTGGVGGGVGAQAGLSGAAAGAANGALAGGIVAGGNDQNVLDGAVTGGLKGAAAGSMKTPPKGKADGGLIQGPGTGISDSIPAAGPQGQPLRVAHGEYIIPADVVGKFGASAFDKLVADHHVPADMQRAIMGE